MNFFPPFIASVARRFAAGGVLALCLSWMLAADESGSAGRGDSTTAQTPVISFALPSVMTTSGLISAYFKKAYPRFTDYVAMASVGLTMNMDLSDLDMAGPLALDLYYLPQPDKKQGSPFAFAISGNKKRKILPAQLKLWGTPFYPVVPNPDEKPLVLVSQRSLRTLQPHLPDSKPGTVEFFLDRKALGTAFSLDEVMMPFLTDRMDPNFSPSQKNARIRELRFKLRSFDSLLDQFEHLKLTMNPAPKELSVDVVIRFRQNSLFSALPEQLANGQNSEPVSVPEQAAIVASVSLDRMQKEKTADLRTTMKQYFNGFCKESGEPANTSHFLETLCDASNGNFIASAGEVQGILFSRLDCKTLSALSPELAKVLSESKRTAIPNLWLLRTYSHRKESLYCYYHPGNRDCFSLFLTALNPSAIDQLLKKNRHVTFPPEIVSVLRMDPGAVPGQSPLFTLVRSGEQLILKVRMEPDYLRLFLSFMEPAF